MGKSVLNKYLEPHERYQEEEFKLGNWCGIHCGKYNRKTKKLSHCFTCHNLKIDKEKADQALEGHRTDKVHR